MKRSLKRVYLKTSFQIIRARTNPIRARKIRVIIPISRGPAPRIMGGKGNIQIIVPAPTSDMPRRMGVRTVRIIPMKMRRNPRMNSLIGIDSLVSILGRAGLILL